ncbi:Alpha-1A adrenergic receptor [Trichoplax sp. H2]|nr:Alpha-1A adrenergic receptor [Trichoplax sp. H2]|eukprot:RDD36354.1 Alpha-1A adrenergic receptor [Trichoplax sp. H2]
MNTSHINQTLPPPLPTFPGVRLDPRAIDISATVLISLSIFTNGIAILVIAMNRKIWNITHGILASMFTASLLYETLYALPFNHFLSELAFSAPLFCSLIRGIGLTLMFITTLHHCLICLNRYLNLAYPFTYRQRASYRYALPAIIMVWIIGIITGSIPYYSFRIPVPTNRCIVSIDNEAERIYVNTATSILYFLPLVIMIISYGHLFYVINNKPKVLSLIRSNKVSQSFLEVNKKLIQQTFGILGVYIILWMPYQTIFLLISNYNVSFPLYNAFRMLRLFALFYLVINPLLFIYHISTLRKETMRTFTKRIPSKRTNSHNKVLTTEFIPTITYESNV